MGTMMFDMVDFGVLSITNARSSQFLSEAGDAQVVAGPTRQATPIPGPCCGPEQFPPEMDSRITGDGDVEQVGWVSASETGRYCLSGKTSAVLDAVKPFLLGSE